MKRQKPLLLSLVLATYGRCDDVGRMLASLALQTDPDFEVIVVDQNPDERLQPHITQGRRQGLRIRHLRLREPNLSAARNVGIDAALGEVIGFPDDDGWYEPDTVASVRLALTDPQRDGIAGQWVEQQAASGQPVPAGTLQATAWQRFKGRHASSITLFLRRRGFERWGNFDPRLGVGRWYGAGEEVDLLMRWLSGGARLDHVPQVHVHHACAPRRGLDLVAQGGALRRRGRGVGALYAKHRMGLWVVLRGLAGQTLRPLLAGRPRAAVLGVCSAWGSLEGLLRWHGTGQNQPPARSLAHEP